MEPAPLPSLGLVGGFTEVAAEALAGVAHLDFSPTATLVASGALAGSAALSFAPAGHGRWGWRPGRQRRR